MNQLLFNISCKSNLCVISSSCLFCWGFFCLSVMDEGTRHRSTEHAQLNIIHFENIKRKTKKNKKLIIYVNDSLGIKVTGNVQGRIIIIEWKGGKKLNQVPAWVIFLCPSSRIYYDYTINLFISTFIITVDINVNRGFFFVFLFVCSYLVTRRR